MIRFLKKFNKHSVYRKFSTLPKPVNNFSFQNQWKNAKPFESIPGLSKFDVIRRFLPGGMFYKHPVVDIMKELKDEYGPISKFPGLFGRPSGILIFNAEDAEKMFRHEGQFPFRRTLDTLEYYRKNIRPEVYEEYGGLFTEQGRNWYKMRKLVNPVMMKPDTVKLYVTQIDSVAKDFIKTIMNKRDSNGEVPANFYDFINLWSLESIACITLSVRLGILEPKSYDENGEKLIKLIRKLFATSHDFEINPSIWRIYHTKAFKELLSVYDGLTNIILNYVDKAMEDLKSKPQTEDREKSLLEKLVKTNKNVAVVMCADAMLAGVDTTSSAAIGILYCLAKNQDKQEKLREELRQTLPNKDDELTTEKMQNMPYLRAVIKEGIRIYSPVIGTVRKITEDLVLSDYRVPKGTENLRNSFQNVGSRATLT